MVDHIVSTVVKTFNLVPFSGATWFLLAIIAFFAILFIRANHNPNSPVSWEDLILDNFSRKASPYKLGYLIGLIVATWVVVDLTDKDKLTLDIFAAYLTYLLGGAGWGLGKKTPGADSGQGQIQPDPDPAPTPAAAPKAFPPPPGN